MPCNFEILRKERFVSQMARDCYDVQLDFCDSLETLADELPSALNDRQSRVLLLKISHCLEFFHEFEENTVFPSLVKMFPGDERLKSSLKRLSGEHLADRDFVRELVYKLDTLGNNPSPREVDTLAYMLRGVFEGLRRHIAFEREHLIGLLVTNSNALHPA